MAQVPDLALEDYRKGRQEHWNNVANQAHQPLSLSSTYHRRLQELFVLNVPPGRRVLELGCGQGDLLAALNPSAGVGVDFSQEMIRRGQQRHPDLKMVCADAHDVELEGTFDIIILSEIINDAWDVQKLLNQARRYSTSNTRLILNFFSRIWELPLRAARMLGLAQPLMSQNWLATEDVKNLLGLAGFEAIRTSQEVLLPLPIPLLNPLMNKFIVRLWPFRHLALCNLMIARPLPRDVEAKPMSVSIIVPARNESGNVAAIFARTPDLGAGTELVFVEGHSDDDTYAAIERAITANPQRKCKLLRQTGKGKGDAVRLGFNEATGDILMILDADLTMPPEDLYRYYNALLDDKGEFINGVRLVYPMERQAMRFLNLLGNKFFSLAFSWLLGQSVKDTLCGTKVLRKGDYELIAANRAYFGDFDPFGDFDLLFGAAKLNMKIVDVPIRYRERVYGTTNIQRFKHGLLLLRMTAFAARRLKFI